MRKKVNKKAAIIELLCVITLAVLLNVFLYKKAGHISVMNDLDAVEVQTQDYDLMYYIADESIDDKIAVLRGWVISQKLDSAYFDSSIVLKNQEKGRFYQVNTAFQLRKDVTEIYGNGQRNYDNSGMITKIQRSKLPKGKYQVYIHYNVHSDNCLLKTNVTFEN